MAPLIPDKWFWTEVSDREERTTEFEDWGLLSQFLLPGQKSMSKKMWLQTGLFRPRSAVFAMAFIYTYPLR